MSINCPQCGSNKLDFQEKTIPGDVLGGFRTVARCNNCLSVFTLKPSAKSNHTPNGKKSAIPLAIHSAIVDALDHAKTKHPHFADTDTEAGVVIAEELLEVNDAALRVMQNINDQDSRDNLFIELAQAIATEIRMMEKLLEE